ncbi:hypothetical protein ACFQY7_37905 [Actinomadura luteofluorescens]|uniref:hypothetical protein n=1 Tax=Actinomadura luteofluorescens TaxID=46163 RepID=UPI003641E211
MPRARHRPDANAAFQAAPQPSTGESPKLVFQTAPGGAGSGASKPQGAPWAPWADGPPQPKPRTAPRTRRVIVANSDGSGWHWGEEDDTP